MSAKVLKSYLVGSHMRTCGDLARGAITAIVGWVLESLTCSSVLT